MTHERRRRVRLLLSSLALGIATALTGLAGPAAAQNDLPPGPNRDLVYGACRTCHDLRYLTESAGISRDDWDAVIDGMRQYGLRIPTERRTKILDYLATYLGPNPPKAVDRVNAAPREAAAGDKLFEEQCAACHQVNGAGQPGAFPPLAGNPDLMRDRLFPVFVILYGLEGKIVVEGREFSAQMPAFDHLDDAQIAALVEYIRTAWNNAARRPARMTPVDAGTVAKARTMRMSPAGVHAYRARTQ